MSSMIRKLFNHPMYIGLIKLIYIYIADRPYKSRKSSSKKSNRNIYVSYLTEPFKKSKDKKYLNKHQNRRETLLLDRILNKLHLNSTFERFDRPSKIKKNYDIVFGLEPNFIKASKRNPNALKIYYATGAYCEHQNKVIQDRTKSFNDIHKCKVKESRLVSIHNAPEIADYIIQIGSRFTIETYPENLRSKIITIRQTCHSFKFNDFINRKIDRHNKEEFVWMGSGGSILKGFDLVMDYFLENPQKTLHIVGPIDSDVAEFYADTIAKANNIHNHGFLDLDSPELEEIALKSTFVLMPSASEGCPGAVINMMKLGCIPIVTKYAAFDEIEQYGFLIENFTTDSIDKAICQASLLNDQEITELIKHNYDFANSNFNPKVFEEDMTNAFTRIMKNHSTH